jgi:hypothetical protein
MAEQTYRALDCFRRRITGSGCNRPWGDLRATIDATVRTATSEGADERLVHWQRLIQQRFGERARYVEWGSDPQWAREFIRLARAIAE